MSRELRLTEQDLAACGALLLQGLAELACLALQLSLLLWGWTWFGRPATGLGAADLLGLWLLLQISLAPHRSVVRGPLLPRLLRLLGWGLLLLLSILLHSLTR